MTQDNEWATGLTRLIGENVRTFRGKLGLSAEALSKATAAEGYAVPRNAITNLENGRKQNVSVQEFLILAGALNVPPAALVASPFEPMKNVALFPQGEFKSLTAYYQFGPHLPDVEPDHDLNGIEQALKLCQSYLDALVDMKNVIKSKREWMVDLGENSGRPSQHLLNFYDEEISNLEKKLDKLVDQMKSFGITPWSLKEMEAPSDDT